jgi:hypothetical protein
LLRLRREQPRAGQAIAIDDIRARSLELDRRIRRRRVPGLLLFATILVLHAAGDVADPGAAPAAWRCLDGCRVDPRGV